MFSGCSRVGADPGQTRLTEFLQRSSRRAWGPERATAIMTAAETTLRLWGKDGMDFDELAADIAARAEGPTKAGDACLREALLMAADHARKIDPTLGARYHRLMVHAGKHHTSAVCTIAGVLLTCIAAGLRHNTRYELRDTDGTPITEQQGREIVAQRYAIPAETRTARRQLLGDTLHQTQAGSPPATQSPRNKAKDGSTG